MWINTKFPSTRTGCIYSASRKSLNKRCVHAEIHLRLNTSGRLMLCTQMNGDARRKIQSRDGQSISGSSDTLTRGVVCGVYSSQYNPGMVGVSLDLGIVWQGVDVWCVWSSHYCPRMARVSLELKKSMPFYGVTGHPLTHADKHRVNCVQSVGRHNLKVGPTIRCLLKDFREYYNTCRNYPQKLQTLCGMKTCHFEQ